MALLPMLPLRGLVVFPGMEACVEVGRPKSIEAIKKAIADGGDIFLTTQKHIDLEEPDLDQVFRFGTVAKVTNVTALENGNIRVVIKGKERARLKGLVNTDPFYLAEVEIIPESDESTPELRALAKQLLDQFARYVQTMKKIPAGAMLAIVADQSPSRIADTVAAQLHVGNEEKQKVLERVGVEERLRYVLDMVNRIAAVGELDKKISNQVQKQIEKSQREYYLREQLKAIQRELGESDDKAGEIEELRTKVAQAQLPPNVEEKVLKEIDRLEKMPPMSAETVVVRNYLDWVLCLPWNVETKDNLDTALAERVLDEDHYGLEKPKQRILEYLAVCQLRGSVKGSALCFVGPPGVGKTSLARSIARALGRKYVRISLGGVRDEAEIRGHRRTYVGALPGRIIQGMKTAGSRNPVFLMDEVDKLGADFRGDPSSALLEVLDPEQNFSFSDHYLEVPFDLSRVMFITTANSVHTIPGPLLDRMEVIQIPGYDSEDKLHIARQFLIPKQLKENGLKPAQVNIAESAVKRLIQEYTREAGVRNLERQIASLCRKSARLIVQGKRKVVRVSGTNITKLLGVPRYKESEVETESQVGLAIGLAVTEWGGDVMPVEVTTMPGKGNLILTGKLGEVLKESAQAALGYLRANGDDLGIPPEYFEKHDIHVHLPEGAIPKDGPSAGIAIATGLLSAITERRIRCDTAMTGEITLRGKVLAIGGVREKVLAAQRAGLRRIVLPVQNRAEVEEIPSRIAKRSEFIFVRDIRDVWNNVFFVDTPWVPCNNVLDKTMGTQAQRGVN